MIETYSALLKLLLPETIVLGTILAALVIDSVALRGMPAKGRLLGGAVVSAVGCGIALACILLFPASGDWMESLTITPLTQLVKAGLLVLAILTVWLAAEQDFTNDAGEFFAILLLGLLGMMFLVSSNDLLVIFLSLELTSVSLYILTGFQKRDPNSSEAALKYFLFGAVSAAFTLFGFSLLYGAAGNTNLTAVSQVIARGPLDPMLLLGLIMTLAGLGFKVAAVPFHLWAPEAYQGAPIPAAAFIASGSKLASFFVLARVLLVGFSAGPGEISTSRGGAEWVPLVGLLGAASMVLGNVTAIVQRQVRSLIAFSAVAHAGYVMIGLLGCSSESVAAVVFYMVTYGFAVIGAFGVVAEVERRRGGSALADFAGLHREAPVLSFCMLVFMLSLAGIPPLAGFFGKFYLFTAAIRGSAGSAGILWLVALALLLSAVSLYYYLVVLKQIYVAEPEAQGAPVRQLVLPTIPILVLAGLVLAFGCCPGCWVGRLLEAIGASGFVSG